MFVRDRINEMQAEELARKAQQEADAKAGISPGAIRVLLSAVWCKQSPAGRCGWEGLQLAVLHEIVCNELPAMGDAGLRGKNSKLL